MQVHCRPSCGAWSRCLFHRMKLEGEEKAKLLAKALQMSLAYQFVTPLTSMTMRGLVDEDGLEPVIDKPTEGMISAVGEAVGLGEASGGFNSPPFLSLPGSPLGEFLNHIGFLKGFPVAGQMARAPGLRQAAPTPISLPPALHGLFFPTTPLPTSPHTSCCLLAQPEPPLASCGASCERMSVGGWHPRRRAGTPGGGPDWPLGPGCTGTIRCTCLLWGAARLTLSLSSTEMLGPKRSKWQPS